MEILVSREIKLPEAPGVLMAGNDEVSTQDLERDQLIRIGQEWTSRLLVKAGMKPLGNNVHTFSVISRDESKIGMTPLNLGQIIDELENAIRESEDEDGGYCSFDFGGNPSGFNSYRGYYERLGWAYCGEHHSEIRADQVLQSCKEAVGNTFTGWKGGDYTMGRETEVHIACPGCTTPLRVVGVGKYRYTDCCIITKPFDD